MTDQQIPNEGALPPSLNRDPITGTPGSHPIGTGIGTVGGMSAGLALGTVVAGPLGSAVGGLLGSVAGAFAGNNLGEAVNPTRDPLAAASVVPGASQLPIDPVAEDLYWQRAFITEPYYDPSLSYDDYGPAYRIGIAHRLGEGPRLSWEESEAGMESLWQHRKGISQLSWDQARAPIEAAWQRVDHLLSCENPYFGAA